MQMQTLAGRNVHPKSHTKREDKNTHTGCSCCTLFIVAVTLGSSSFFFLFEGYLHNSASLYSLPLVPHLVFFLGLGLLRWWPFGTSVRWAKSWGRGQAGLDPAPRSWFLAVLSPSLWGVRALTSSGGRKAGGESTEAWVLILPLLLTCSVTLEKDPTLSGPQFPSL